MPGPRASLGGTRLPRRRTAPLSDIRSAYSPGGSGGQAQVSGSPGYINTQAVRQGRAAPVSYTPAYRPNYLAPSLTQDTTPTSTLPWLQDILATAAKPVPSVIDRNNDGLYDPTDTVSLLRKVGATPAEAQELSTKVMGESGGDPRAIGDDAAAGYGNTFGLGLFQMTTGVGNDDLINKYGGQKAMLRPKPNARAALELYRGGGIDNWYAPSGPPGDVVPLAGNSKAQRAHDKATNQLASLGLAPQDDPSLNKKPFKQAALASMNGPSRIIDPKWDDDSDAHTSTMLNSAINPLVKKFSKKYGFTVGGGYDPGGGHVSEGHNVEGTATDIYPRNDNWSGKDLADFEKGLKVLDAAGFEVGYGTEGIGEAWAGHGRNDHAHVEWLGQGSDPNAAQNLAGLTNKKILQNYKSFTPQSGSSGLAPAASGGFGGGTLTGTADDRRDYQGYTPAYGSGGAAGNPLSALAAQPQGLEDAETDDLLSILSGGPDSEEEPTSELDRILRSRRFRPGR